MKRILPLFLLLFCQASFSQVTIQPGTSITVLTGTNLDAQQDFTIQNTGSLIINGTVQLKSNMLNSGTLTVNAPGRIIMNGTGAQNFNSTGPLSIPILSVNSPLGITLNNAVTILDSLDLQNGIITSSASAPLHFAAGSKSPIESSSSYILGTAMMDARTVGTSAMNQFLGAAITAGTDLGNVTLTRTTGPTGIVTVKGQNSIAAKWQINTSVAAAAANRNLSFSWLPAFDNVQNVMALNLFGSTGANYIRLSPVPVNANTTPRLFAQNNMVNFSQTFVLSSANMNLPVILNAFDVAKQGNAVILNWSASLETGMAGYEIQRAVDGINFSNIGFVQPTGNSGANNYEFNDRGPVVMNSGTIYYRLKMMDIDGQFTYSAVKTIHNEDNSPAYEMTAYPNPFRSTITLHIKKPNTDPLHVTIVNKNGATVYSAILPASRNESVSIGLPASLPSGVYYMKVTNNEYAENIKLVKAN